MRRWVMGLLLLPLLAACALWPGGEEATPTLPPPRLLTPTPLPAYPAEMSGAARILARGQLVVGVRYDLEPWAFIGEDGELQGLDVDLARELARRWLGNAQAVSFVQVRADTAVPMVQAGQLDLAFAGLDWTQRAEQGVNFGPPYAVNGLAILTYPDTGINTPADVVSRTLVYLADTDTAELLRAQAPLSATLVPAEGWEQAMAWLAARQVDGYVDQRFRLERARRSLTGARIVAPVTQTWWAPIYAENDAFFADLITLTLEDLWRDGTLSALYARWLPDAPLPALTLHTGDAALPDLHTAPPLRNTRDTLASIRATQAMTVAYLPDRWPYSGMVRGQPSGFEVRLVQAMAELWLGNKEAVSFVPMDTETALEALRAGEVHLLIGGWEMSRAAELSCDFSLPYYDDGGSWLSLAAAPRLSLEELGEQPLGVISGTLEADWAASWPLRPPLVGYASLEEALLGLRYGEIGAIFGPRQPLLEVAYTQNAYVVGDERWQARPIALVLPPGDSAFRDWVNATFYALQEKGLYPELFKTWFDDPQPFWPPWPGPAPQVLVLTRL